MNRDRGRYYFTVLLIGVLVLGAGCAKAPSDSQLSDEIHSKFKQDSGLQDKAITVQVAAGVVTLSGVVDNDAERTAAARYASMTPRIREVVNNLQITAAAPSAEIAQNSEPSRPAPAPSPAEPESKSRPGVSRQRTEKLPPTDSFSDQSSNSSPSSTTSSSNTRSRASYPSNANANTEPSPAEIQAADVSSTSSGKTDGEPDAPPAPPDAPAPLPSNSNSDPKLMTIEAGTAMAIRLVDRIDSETAQPGQTFRATLDSPLSVEWDVAIPAGYNVEGHVAEVKSAGKFAGQSELVLTLDKILVHDKTYDIQTDQYRRKGKNQSTNTAEKVGAGAALGAIIGGIAGGGKGAGIGAAAGGGLGGASQAAGKGHPVRLDSETVLHFTLESPLTVTQVEQGPEQERHKLQPAK